MQPTDKAKQIFTRFNSYNFKPGRAFSWNHSEQTVTYAPLTSLESLCSLLHEVSHGELGHDTFSTDIELIRREAAAWQHATNVLAPSLGIVIDPDYIEDHLDTYRLWLHARSLCPNCRQNGIQHTQNTYRCINCRCLWRVNDARVCRLQRVRLQDQSRSA